MKDLSKAAKKKLGFQGSGEDPSTRKPSPTNFNSNKNYIPDYTRDNSTGRTPKSEQTRYGQVLRGRNRVGEYQREKRKYSYPEKDD